MKKSVLLFLITITFFLSSCSRNVSPTLDSDLSTIESSNSQSNQHYDIEPLTNPDIVSFDEFYVNEFYIGKDFIGINYRIFKRTVIENKVYVSLGYGLNDGYLLNTAHLDNYRVLYGGEYYNLQQGYQLGLYTAEDLIDFGVKGVHRSCSYDDSCN